MPPNVGSSAFHGLYEGLGVGYVQFDVEHVDVRVDFEQQSFSFHHGFGGLGAYVAQAQHRGTVGDHGHQVALGGVFVHVVHVGGDFQARNRHAGRVGDGEVALCVCGFRGYHFNFSRATAGMVFQYVFFPTFVLISNLP